MNSEVKSVFFKNRNDRENLPSEYLITLPYNWNKTSDSLEAEYSYQYKILSTGAGGAFISGYNNSELIDYLKEYTQIKYKNSYNDEEIILDNNIIVPEKTGLIMNENSYVLNLTINHNGKEYSFYPGRFDNVVVLEIGENISDWQYSKDEENKTVTLEKYNGTNPDVMVYGAYNIDGDAYRTIFKGVNAPPQEGHNQDENTVIQTVSFKPYTIAHEDLSNAFAVCTSLTKVDFTGIDAKNTTTLSGMFKGCVSLITFRVFGVNFEKVTDMSEMLSGCIAFNDSYAISNGFYPSATDLSSMFYGCTGLENINIYSHNFPSAYNLSSMFYSCTSLKRVNIGFKDCTVNMQGMFQGCNSITEFSSENFENVRFNNIGYCFGNCTSLTTADFNNIDWTGGMLIPDTTEYDYAFNGCSALLNVYTFNEKEQGKIQSSKGFPSSAQVIVGSPVGV